MRKSTLTYWLFLGAIFTMSWACSDSDDDGGGQPPVNPTEASVTVTPDTMILSGTSAGRQTFNLKVEGDTWEITKPGDATWLTVNPMSGEEGDNIIILQPEVNPNDAVRTTYLTITLKKSGKTARLGISQESGIVHYNLQTDSLALVALYNALDGANWKKGTGGGKATPQTRANNQYPWDLSMPVNTWSGITVATVEGEPRVTEISLEMVDGFKGTLPGEIGNFNALKVLSLNGKQLTGKVPAEIVSLRTLEEFNLFDASIDWVVPDNIAQMENLKVIYSVSLGITVEDVAKLYNLPKLEELSLMTGALAGDLPEGIGKLKNLRVLNLQNTQLKSLPADLGQCTKLEVINMEAANKLASLPADLSTLTEMRIFGMKSCKALKSLPSGLDKMTKMKEFYVEGTSLSAPLDIQFFTNMPELETVYALKANLTGDIAAFKNKKNMVFLQINENQITGELALSEMFGEKIEHLEISNNTISGTLAGVGGLTKLRQLSILNNQITGEIPAEIGQCTELRYFYANDNLLTGTIPVEILNTKLYGGFCFWLKNNHLSGTLSDDLLNAPGTNPATTRFSDFAPATNICPQKDGFQFDNCPTK